jgi:hypothetical protein
MNRKNSTQELCGHDLNQTSLLKETPGPGEPASSLRAFHQPQKLHVAGSAKALTGAKPVFASILA